MSCFVFQTCYYIRIRGLRFLLSKPSRYTKIRELVVSVIVIVNIILVCDYANTRVRHGLGQVHVRFVVKLTITRVFNNNDTKSVVIVHIVRHIQRPAGDVTIIYTISCAYYFIYYYCRTSTSVVFVLQVILYWCILVFIPIHNLNSCLLRRSCRKRKPLRTYIQ